jgi:oligopeptide/dipeptide ABC transporter ATP-binding protein
MLEDQPILKVDHVKKYFSAKRHHIVKAVDDVSFSIGRGRTLGLVGESGCGKSTLGKCILKLQPVTQGTIFFKGQAIEEFKGDQGEEYRKGVQAVFQDPYGSLNPRMRVGEIIEEPLFVHKVSPKKERRRRVEELIEKVGLKPDHLRRFPHEFSGGQRQRICIARALSLNPQMIVLDEPVSALDVSIQAQILNLLMDLKEEFQLTYLFISHALSVVEHISDVVAVMYLGRIVETAPSEVIFKDARHPYTKALLSAVLNPDPEGPKPGFVLEGDVGESQAAADACRFLDRCPNSVADCRVKEPVLREVGAGHHLACFIS